MSLRSAMLKKENKTEKRRVKGREKLPKYRRSP
jgi:hypothetical protein